MAIKERHDEKILDFEWQKIRQTEGVVIDKHLGPYLAKVLSEHADIVGEAWSEFTPEEELPEEVYEEFLHNMFFPWLFFNWVPHPKTLSARLIGNRTIALKYLEEHKNKLDEYECDFIKKICKSYYSFYVVLEVKTEQYICLKDIFLHTEHKIKERQGTHYLKRGDIVFARILTLKKQSIFVGMAPYSIDARYHSSLLDYRKQLEADNGTKKMTPNLLRKKYGWELLDVYFDILIERFQNPMATFQNTDGDLIENCNVECELKLSPEEAFLKLMPLTLSNNVEEFLEEAERNEAGEIICLEFPWFKKGNSKFNAWNNTVMGSIILRKNKLIAEVNSQKRAKTLQKLLTKYLKEDIGEIKILIKPMKVTLAENTKNTEDFNEQPEVQAALNEMCEKHWENWFNESIPALKDKTPREAAKTKEGREQLDALLLYYENVNLKNNRADIFTPDVNDLRKKLGLPES